MIETIVDNNVTNSQSSLIPILGRDCRVSSEVNATTDVKTTADKFFKSYRKRFLIKYLYSFMDYEDFCSTYITNLVNKEICTEMYRKIFSCLRLKCNQIMGYFSLIEKFCSKEVSELIRVTYSEKEALSLDSEKSKKKKDRRIHYFDEYVDKETFLRFLWSKLRDDLPEISSLGTYRFINSNFHFSEESVFFLSRLRNAKDLYLEKANITNTNLDYLSNMIKTTYSSLEELSLDFNPISNISSLVSALKTQRHFLTKVSLKGVESLDKDQIQLLFNNLKTEELDIGCNKLNTESIKAIGEGIVHNTTLKTLRLARCGLIREAQLLIFSCVKNNRSISILDVRKNDSFSKREESLLTPFTMDNKLQKLIISNDKISLKRLNLDTIPIMKGKYICFE